MLYNSAFLFLDIREYQLIHRRPNTKCAVRDNPYQKQRDERFPQRDTEYARDDKCKKDSRRDIYYGNIKQPVSVGAFSRASEYVFVTAKVEPKDFHDCGFGLFVFVRLFLYIREII